MSGEFSGGAYDSEAGCVVRGWRYSLMCVVFFWPVNRVGLRGLYLSLILAVRVLCSDLSKRPVGLILCVLALQSLANRLLKYQ